MFTRCLMGKLKFHRYLISRLYPTREICKNLMHAKNMFYSSYKNPRLGFNTHSVDNKTRAWRPSKRLLETGNAFTFTTNLQNFRQKPQTQLVIWVTGKMCISRLAIFIFITNYFKQQTRLQLLFEINVRRVYLLNLLIIEASSDEP